MIDSAAPAQPMVWSVAALVHAVADALSARFAGVAVRGELGSFTRAASGHCYFTLKDDDGSASMRCAMFRRAAALLDFAPQDGQQVELRGRVAVYEPRGELQLVVESMRRAGAGALMEQFLRLKAKLEAEGLFDAQRKRPLPGFAQRVGVVTSLAAAALRDVASALARRAPHVQLLVYPAVVQGADAPPQLVHAIELAGRRAEVDLLIVCRGGGSVEDLWAFNDERVVRAVAACPVPVISGVGHETDVTLTDFAADVRAPTPTAAAELAAAPRQALLAALANQQRRLARALRARLDRLAQRLDRLAPKIARPVELLQRQHRMLDGLAQRRHGALVQAVAARRQVWVQLALRARRSAAALLVLRRVRLEAAGAQLRALDPRAVLARGYALVRTAEGDLVVAPAQLRDGLELRLTLAGGRAALRAQQVRPVADDE